MTRPRIRSFMAAGASATVLFAGFAGLAPQAFAKSPVHHAAVKPGSGVIVDGLYEEPNLLNPAAGPTETYGGMVMTSLFANLYYTTPQGKILPRIATALPTITDGGKTYTFTLKHTKWSNGTPFTANDVVATWHLVMSKGFVAASTVGWTDVKSIHVINDYKFTMTLDKPFQPLVTDIFATDYPGIVPAQVFDHLTGVAANKAAYNDDPTPSNGPFKFKKWVSGAYIEVVPNPYWVGPKPKAKEIVFEVVPSDNTLLADAQSHSINVFYFDPVNFVSQLEAIKGATVHFTVQPAWEAITLNMRDPFLDNVKVRQALQMSINTTALINDVWDHHAIPAAADQPPDSFAHNPNLKPYPYDPTLAKKYLAAAGFKPGKGGYLYKDGKEFTLTYATTSDNPWRGEDQRLIQFWMGKIGVKVNLKTLPANAYFGSFLPSGQGWQMGEFEYAEGLDPEAGMLAMYGTGQVSNFGDFSNKQLDQLFNTALYQTTQAARAKTLQKAEAIIHTQLPQLFLYSPQEIDTSINMTGYVPNPFMIDTWNCYDWALTKS